MKDLELLGEYVQKGSEAAFSELVRRHIDWVQGAALRQVGRVGRVGRRQMAEDVTQGVFIALLQQGRKLVARGRPLAPWLLKVVRYASIASVRAEMRRKQHEQGAAAMRAEVEKSLTEEQWEEMAPLLDDLVGKLGKKDQEAVLLRFYQRKSLAEVGEEMGVSEAAAQKRVERAVEKLRGMFRRKGMAVGSSMVLAAGLEAYTTAPASAELVAATTQSALAAVQGGAVGGQLVAIAEGAMKMMKWTTVNVAVAIVGGLMLVGGGAVLHSQEAAVATKATTTAPAAQAEGSFYYGRVVSPDGKAVAGAQVYFVDRDSWTLRRRIVATATSDAEGRFKLTATGNPPGRVLVQAEGFGLSIGSVNLETDEKYSAEIEMMPPAEVRVRFVDAEDRAVAGVQVVPTAIRSKRAFTLVYVPEELEDVQTTDANGECVFKGMPYEQILRLEVRDDRYAQSFQNTSAPIGEPKTTVLKLARAADIAGRVVLAKDGAPVAGVRIGVQGTNDSRDAGWGSDVTDGQGNYHIRGVAPGQYNILVDLKGELAEQYVSAALERVTLGPGQSLAGQDFRLVSGGIITGTATVEGTGEPVPGLYIGVHGPARPRSGAWIESALTGPDGRFAIRVAPGVQYVYCGSQPPLGLEGKGGEDGREVMVEDGGTAATAFVFRPSAAPPVRGRVKDVDGKPVSGARVTVEDPKADVFGGSGSVQTDVEGRFFIQSAADGARVSAAKGRARTEKAAVVDAGNRDLTLMVGVVKPSSARVLVLTDDGKPVEGVTVELLEIRGQGGTTVEERKSGADGSVVFRKLVSTGQYHVMTTAMGEHGVGQSKLEPRAGEEVEVRVTVPEVDSLAASGVTGSKLAPATGPATAMVGHTRPWLGISISSVDDPQARQVAAALGYTGKAGVLVQQVMPGSPASGILREGDILTEANGESLLEAEILIDHVALAGVGGKLTLMVFREKKTQEVEMRVGAAPASAVKVRPAGK